MTDFFNRVRNVASGRPASAEPEFGAVQREPQFRAGQSNTEAANSNTSAGGNAQTALPDCAPDLLGISPAVRRLAETIAHSATSTPLAIGILGQAGAGKTFALNRLLANIAAFASSAARTPGSPFVAQTVIARVDAAGPGEAATRIAAALFEALHRAGPDGRSYPALAEEASEAVTDPVEAARIARERLSDARRRLDSEREALQEMNGRRNRLAESVLYEASGSRIDSHARANRASIESRLRGFGFTSGDPVATYKDLVRDVAENGGVTGRVRACLRAIWGFRGQTKLIVLALIFFAVAWGMGELQTTRTSWLGWLHGQEALKPATTWIENNIAWLATAKQAAIWAGILSLLLNLLRATRFILPIFRGVSLFKSDVETRHRDLDTLIGNQTRRVDDLAAEIEPLNKRTAEAERRAANVGGTQQSTKSPFAGGSAHQAAAFISALGAAAAGNSPNTPQRIVVAFDNLDALSSDAAVNFMAHAQELLARPAYVTVLTAAEAGGNALARFVDLPLRLSYDNQRLGNLVKAILGTGTAEATPETPVNAAASSLNQPLHPAEAEMLEKLAALAARSPRDVKRFVTAYRLTRDGFEHFGALALALALQSGASEEERATLNQSLEGAPDNLTITMPDFGRIKLALDAANAGQGSQVTAGQLREAHAVAAQWSVCIAQNFRQSPPTTPVSLRTFAPSAVA